MKLQMLYEALPMLTKMNHYCSKCMKTTTHARNPNDYDEWTCPICKTVKTSAKKAKEKTKDF
jgi:rubrerythrin